MPPSSPRSRRYRIPKLQQMSLEDETSPFVRKALSKLALRAGAKILDAPCGYGRHAHWLASLGYRVSGADIDEERLSEAAATAPTTPHPIRWYRADLETTGPVHRRFDLLLVVHYYSPNIVTRARELLRPGGFFIYESFGAQGRNYLSLPQPGAFGNALSPDFEILSLTERPAGQRKHAVVVKAVTIMRYNQ